MASELVLLDWRLNLTSTQGNRTYMEMPRVVTPGELRGARAPTDQRTFDLSMYLVELGRLELSSIKIQLISSNINYALNL